ncbi:MAG: hypothetical protein AAGB31_09425 [Bdellovibrio sp.]
MNMGIYFFVIFITVLSGPMGVWASSNSMEEEVPIILRGPAANSDDTAQFQPEARARVQTVLDNKTLRAVTSHHDWYVGEILGVESQTAGVGIIGFVEVTGIQNRQDGTFHLTAELLRQSRVQFIQVGDSLMHLDLSTTNEKYKGTTDLIIKEFGNNVSAKYKPLFTQGVSVGETAQTLGDNEYLVTWYGQVYYGWKRWLTVNTIVPANFLGAANFGVKTQLYHSVSNHFSGSLNYAKIPNKSSSALNMSIYWDSVSSESVISHTLLTIALYSFEKAEDATAIKALGTSSFQTGHEFILDNWDRILLGPSYNFEKKAVGGYITYLKIWDRFHFSLSVNATDVASFQFSPDGYYLSFDAYWRF